MKKHASTVVIILILSIGSVLLLYPSVSDYWNSLHASQAIANYSENVAELDTDQYKQFWRDAERYNDSLPIGTTQYILDDEQSDEYNSLLNVGGTGIMSYIEIPEQGVSLPIYHGTSDATLQIAAGHMEWTSLPVGGESTHCVISGHRGLPSAKLFTNLNKMEIGDIFFIRTLNETLSYEVDQVIVVEPTDTQALQIVEGEDLCTLLTCTPYGINSHRLLVRGHRIANGADAQTVYVTSDAGLIDPKIVAAVLCIPLLLILLIFIKTSEYIGN